MELPQTVALDAALRRALFGAVTDGVAVFDTAGNLLHFNDAQAHISGFASRDEMGRHLDFFAQNYELSHPEGGVLPVSEWPVSRALRGESFQDWSLGARRLDTGRAWRFHFSGEAVRDANGQIIMAVVVTRDVTALHESQQRSAAIFAHAPFGISLSRASDLALVSVNDAFLELFECTRDEVLGQRSLMSTLVDAASRQKVADELHQKGSVRDLEVVRQTKQGHALALSINVDKLTIDGVPMVLTTMKDISLRREAKHRLEVSEARYRAIFNQAAMGVALVDTATSRMLEPNNRLCEMLGYTRDELRRLSWQTFTHPDDVAANEAGLRQMVVTQSPFRTEKRYLRKDGTVVWVRLTVSPVTLPGEPLSTQIALMEDITEQRLVAEQLRQAQKLESIGQLAGGVAHDFNNLLTVILSCSGTLRQDLERGLPPNLEDVREIAEAGERARDLTRQLLAFSRRQVIQPVALDLNGVVQRSRTMLRRLVGEHVDVRTRLSADLWGLWADPGQVEQVLMNLAVNARDAMRAGGVLSFETDNVPSPAGDCVRLRVSDSGSGMSPEVKAHLFEPFFTTKGPGAGTGLGLATVYGIVTRAGGSIHVETAPGRGTTFDLLFPRSTEGVAAVCLEPDGRPKTGTEAVLVVEDDPHVRDVTTRALAGAGYSLRSCTHPQAALDLSVETLKKIELPSALQPAVTVVPGSSGHASAPSVTPSPSSSASQALPAVSPSVSSWLGLGNAGQLSSVFDTVSPSRSASQASPWASASWSSCAKFEAAAQLSQLSPTPSPSASSWSRFEAKGQLSTSSASPSPSASSL